MNTPAHFNVAVLIGRFQPFHNGHHALLSQALTLADRVFVVLGSSRQARNAKNPFSWEERAAMIAATLDGAAIDRVAFVPVRDFYNDQRWSAAVTASVQSRCGGDGENIALIGFHKNASSYYLKLFPHWTFVATPQYGDIDATSIRKLYFDGAPPETAGAHFSSLLPAPIKHYLNGWSRLPQFMQMRDEHRAIEHSINTWGSGPFVTVDAVVTSAGHVLLVRRGKMPGKGLWALPGGFLELRERVLHGAIRELREETGLALPDSLFGECLKSVAVFDHPERSLRGRTITHAHWFDLGLNWLPEVSGADDAAEARWMPLDKLLSMEETFFEDHFIILNHFLPIPA